MNTFDGANTKFQVWNIHTFLLSFFQAPHKRIHTNTPCRESTCMKN